MSGISGMDNNMMSAIFAQGMQSRQDPAQKFNELDTDGNGGLDKVELSAMAKELAAKTGKSLDVDESISTYDSNSDGRLDQDEMDTMMHEVLGPPSDGMGGGMSQMKDNAPRPPQMQNASSAYGASQGDDETSALLEVLKNISAQVQSSSDGNDSSLSAYLSKLIENINNGTGGSVLNVAA